MNSLSKPKTLFGGEGGWTSEDWTASDDSVRGGKSESHFECKDKTGRFYGTLDIKTLGGAGFASQRTTGNDREWNLSDYVGIQLSIEKGDKKRYTLILKDELLDKDPETGREQATISYECDFELPPQAEPGKTKDRLVTIPWSSLNPTYRGRLKKDAKKIDLTKIKRFSIMMRSFFGSQEGDFSLSIKSITAITAIPKCSSDPSLLVDITKLEKGTLSAEGSNPIQWSRPSSDLAAICLRRRITCFLLGAVTLVAIFSLVRKYC